MNVTISIVQSMWQQLMNQFSHMHTQIQIASQANSSGSLNTTCNYSPFYLHLLVLHLLSHSTLLWTQPDITKIHHTIMQEKLTMGKPHPTLHCCGWWIWPLPWSPHSWSGKSERPLCPQRTAGPRLARWQTWLLLLVAPVWKTHSQAKLFWFTKLITTSFSLDALMVVFIIQWSNTYFKALKLDSEHSVKMPSPDPTSKSPVFNSFTTFTPCEKKMNKQTNILIIVWLNDWVNDYTSKSITQVNNIC